MGKTKKGKNSGKKIKGISGIIRVSQRGTGYFRLPGETKVDAEISYDDLGTALHGDTVSVTVIPGRTRDGGPKARVLKVTKRAKRGFAGELIHPGKVYALKASDPRMYVRIEIPKKDLGGAQVGDKIFVTLTAWRNMHVAPLGKVARVLGRAGEHEAEMQGIILERGFESGFPADVEREAEKIKRTPLSDAEIKKRRDMRGITTFTIDPEDAKDFDDALSFRTLPNNHVEVGIHIADVSHYVTPGTALDKEALDRATSVYLVDRTIPMLPEILSNDLCSLNPHEDKLAMSAIFEMDMQGTIIKEWFGKTIINSNKRFTYEGAQKVLNDGTGDFFHELDTLNKIAKKLNAERIKAGAILMETDEVKFKLDAAGKPISVFIKVRGDTNKLIEEFMLLANRRVAKWGAKNKEGKDRVFIYRIHDEPDKEKIKMLKDYLKLLGFDLAEKNGVVKAHELNRLFKDLEGRAERDTIQSTVIRSMQKAVYSTKNLGHFGLAFEFYTHFTSPIRRYPDIIAHRLLMDYLSGHIIPGDKMAYYQHLAEHSSMREVEAAEAERASVKYKQLQYLAERIGQPMQGVITGINEWGMYVGELTTRAEGVIRLRDISEDRFTFIEKQLMLVGEKSGKILRVGDRLDIVIKSVDLEKQQIDYSFVRKIDGAEPQ
jgi:ribonuclease R